MRRWLLGMFLLILGARQAFPQTVQPPPGSGINFFSHQQDIDIGKESADEAEKELVLVQDVRLNQYIRSIAQRVLTGSSSAPNRFQVHIVNSNEVHSLAFPNGAIYIYRGLLAMTANDAEVAAVVAHEVSHVLSRHATAQLSRQLLVQAPISLSAGLTMSEGWKEQLNKLGVVFGVNATFLHYSPQQEIEASEMTATILHSAGFSSGALESLVNNLVEASKKPDAPIMTFLYNHPLPEQNGDPEDNSKPARTTKMEHHSRPTAEFHAFQTGLQKLPKPPDEKAPEVTDTPLTRLFVHPQNYYRLSYPDDWQVIRTGKDGAIVAPPDGLTTSTAGDDIVLGMMVDMFNLSTSDKPLTLEQATNRLIVFLRQRNQTVRAVPGAQTPILIDDELGLRTVLLQGGVISSGPSIITGKPNVKTEPGEVLWLVTRMYYQNLFYMVFVAPEEEFPSHQQLFEQIIRNLHIR